MIQTIKTKSILVLFKVLVFLVFMSSGYISAYELETREARELVSLVHEAAALVEIKGEASFKEFLSPGTKWKQGDRYLIVVDLEGHMYVHANPDMVGKNQKALKDVNGKPIAQRFIAEVVKDKGKKGHWCHYMFVRPGYPLPEWKTTYITLAEAPSKKEYIIGSGSYDLPMEKAFLVEEVEDAVDAIKSQEKKAFDRFRGIKSTFIFRDTYVFVYDDKGTLYVNPIYSNLEGKNMYHATDATGKFLVREFIDVAKQNGSGWVEYMMPKPGGWQPVQKIAFLKNVTINDQVFVVGSAMYMG